MLIDYHVLLIIIVVALMAYPGLIDKYQLYTNDHNTKLCDTYGTINVVDALQNLCVYPYLNYLNPFLH